MGTLHVERKKGLGRCGVDYKKAKSKLINQSERLALTVSSRSNKDRFAFIM